MKVIVVALDILQGEKNVDVLSFGNYRSRETGITNHIGS